MNSKAIRKQLLAAVAMVLVAAVALGSSTYAWFVSSGTVKAEGMKVQAQTDAGLAIRFKKGTWGTSASAAMDTAMNLYPASTYNLQDWYHAAADSANSYAAKPGTRTTITGNVFSGANGAYADNSYVLMRQFEIRSTAQDATTKGLVVKDVEVTSPVRTMSTALRVGVEYVAGSGESAVHHTRIFAPVTVGQGDNANEPTDNYKVYKGNDNDFETVKLAVKNDKNTSSNTNAIVVPTDVVVPYNDSNGLFVNIYIWFEGEDHNLNSDNFAAEALNITVSFEGYDQNAVADPNAGKVDLKNAAVDPNTTVKIANVTYYLITGATVKDGTTPLYTNADGKTADNKLKSTSEIFAITDAGLVTNYTSNVILPAASGG